MYIDNDASHLSIFCLNCILYGPEIDFEFFDEILLNRRVYYIFWKNLHSLRAYTCHFKYLTMPCSNIRVLSNWTMLRSINFHSVQYSERAEFCDRFLLMCAQSATSNEIRSTHVKISQLVTSLQTSRQQVVFAPLVTTCQQVWNKLLTTCNNLVDIVRLVTRLLQQGCYNNGVTILLQPCVVNLVTFLLYHDCIRLVRTTL